MNLKVYLKALTGLMLSAAFVGIVSCGEKKTADAGEPQPMLIVFASGESSVIRAGKTMEARVGLIVNQLDVIKTQNGTVDLQTKSGSAVRIREHTEVAISKLTKKDTKVEMSTGSLLATVKKESADEEFRVVTPTAIAGVRGTTFSVEVYDGKEPRVKVIDGKVAMAPRIEALEEYSAEEIEKDPALKKLSEVSESNEVVLEEEMEGTLNPEIEKEVIRINKKLETAQSKKESPETVLNTEEIEKNLTEAKKDKEAVSVTESKVTPEEKSEKQTLIVIEVEAFQKIIESADEVSLSDATNNIKEEREQKLEKILTNIEVEASKTTLKSEDEIKEHYEKLETLIMKDGSNMTGAVIAQTDTQLVIHTPEGVKRVEKQEVLAQEF
ncbi:MAG: FecR domain-containing protein [Spirochaetia bacterium]|nr:FecR domain-containing protein [Spirochaetia bacterium]